MRVGLGLSRIGGHPATDGGGGESNRGEGKILLKWPQVIPHFLGDSFGCALSGSGFLLLLVRTPPPPRPGWGKGHIGVAMDSTQTKHICGCRSNMTETALSSLLLLLPYSPYCHLNTTPVAQQPPPGVPPPAWGLLFCQKTPSRGCLSAHGCPLAGGIIYRDICEELGGWSYWGR